MPNNCLSLLYKRIIQVENKNVGLKVGGGGAQTYHCPPIKKVPPPPPPPPPLPTPVISNTDHLCIWRFANKNTVTFEHTDFGINSHC